METFQSDSFMQWVLIPSLIFFSRIVDVSMSTVRIFLIVNEKRGWAAFLSFFEILIWLVAISQILQNLNNIMCYIGFAGGFSLGTYIGMIIEKKLSIGTILIRVITVRKDASNLIESFKKQNYKFTSVEAEGTYGKVNVVYTIAERKNTQNIIELIKQFNPNAFYTIEKINYATIPGSITINTSDKNSFFNFMKKIKMK